MSDTYQPFDQQEKLGPPPWRDGDNLRAWEQAHGHDVRLKCYAEFGCQVIEAEAYESGRAAERERIHALVREIHQSEFGEIDEQRSSPAGNCIECSFKIGDGGRYSDCEHSDRDVSWPCPTIRALDDD